MGTTLGNLGYDSIKFPHPVFHGDTLRGETTILDKRESKSRTDSGIVWFEHLRLSTSATRSSSTCIRVGLMASTADHRARNGLAARRSAIHDRYHDRPAPPARLGPRDPDLLIGGEMAQPEGDTWDVFNPATEAVIATVGGASADQVDAARGRRARRSRAGRRSPARSARGTSTGFADVLEAAADRLLPSIVNEVGTPVSLAEYLQVKMAVQEHLRWAAEAAKVDRTIHLGGYDKPAPTQSDVVYEPVGVVAAITGYNYPLNLAIFKFGAALAAGCTVVLLPSPRTPLTTLFLGDLIQEAGLPPGVMNVVIGGADVGQQLTVAPRRRPGLVHRLRRRRREDHGAGRAEPQGRHPGARRQVAQSLVLPGVDVAEDRRRDAPALVAQRRPGLRRAGPAAGARGDVRRVPRGRRGGVRPDGGRRPLGPGDQRRPDDPARPPARVLGFVDDSVAAGGTKLLEVTKPLPEKGWFVNPVLLGDLPPDARAVQQEIFGPVAVILPFKDTEEAIRLANDTAYGLAANVWCDDPVEARARRPADPGRHGVDQRRRRDAAGRAVRRLRPVRASAASWGSGACASTSRSSTSSGGSDGRSRAGGGPARRGAGPRARHHVRRADRGRMLRDFGADVIKVEDPATGDYARQWTPHEGRPVARLRAAQLGQAVGRHRPAHAHGRQATGAPAGGTGGRRHRVVPARPAGGVGARATTTCRAGQPGAGADQVSRVRPDRAVPGKPGFGTVAETGSGFAFINGWPETPPTSPPFGFADSIAGISAAMGTAMALFRRERTGQGDDVDVALYEPLMFIVGDMMLNYTGDRARPGPRRQRHRLGVAARRLPGRPTASGWRSPRPTRGSRSGCSRRWASRS